MRNSFFNFCGCFLQKQTKETKGEGLTAKYAKHTKGISQEAAKATEMGLMGLMGQMRHLTPALSPVEAERVRAARAMAAVVARRALPGMRSCKCGVRSQVGRWREGATCRGGGESGDVATRSENE